MTRRRGLGSGQLLIATGALHNVVGGYVYRNELAAIFAGGVFGTVRDDRTSGAAALWFFTAGFFMLALGALYRWVEVDLGRTLPVHAGVTLLLLAVFAVALMPENGVWLILPQGVLIIARARRAVSSAPRGPTQESGSASSGYVDRLQGFPP